MYTAEVLQIGLGAYVYRNRARLPFDPSTPGVSIDKSTGVVDFDDPDLYRRFADHVIAVQRRFGNIAGVDELRNEIQRITPEGLPIIQDAILAATTHCGDLIEVSHLDALEREINVLAASESKSDRVDEFLAGIRELVAAAQTEGNPIYFG